MRNGNYIRLDERPRKYVGPRATHAGMMAGLGQCCPSCPPGQSCKQPLSGTTTGNIAAIAFVAFAAWVALKKR